MKTKLGWAALAFFTLAACHSEPPPSARDAQRAPPQPSVFDPWVGTIERAEGVQKTVDDQAAAQRRRIEELER
jgi:hypothetical protein